MGLEDDIFPKDERRRRLLRSRAEGLPFLGQSMPLRRTRSGMGVVDNSIAVKDGDDGAGEVGEG